MYKTQKGLASDGFTEIYHPITEILSYNTRSANKRNLPSPLTNLRAGDKAVSVSGARVWSDFPDTDTDTVVLNIIIKHYLLNRHSRLKFSRGSM